MANDEEGITLGRYYDEATQHVGAKIPYTGERHMLLFGPERNRQGHALSDFRISYRSKTVRLSSSIRRASWPPSPPTIAARIGDVVMLNPFNVLGLGSAGFNPLAALDPDVGKFL